MKKYLFIGILSCQALLFGVDYSQMSIEEMNQMRGKVQASERESFRNAYQEKLQKLPAGERQKYMGRPDGIAPGTGQNADPQGLGGQQMLRDGSGMGMGAGGGGRGR